ncbi:hypothetical protein PIIN_11246 [Serendipita indica DSM 11827]|uniref:Uncharacterized protein n=1 Tax=Serendipita indica (strain DSM 11827) TaxID=1109443 RepID=G4U125_SERID|nr:hypothetical protein PIIN_11246 [Serendipita indica DSM 11827]
MRVLAGEKGGFSYQQILAIH